MDKTLQTQCNQIINNLVIQLAAWQQAYYETKPTRTVIDTRAKPTREKFLSFMFHLQPQL